jgi:hypothetical protein
MERSIDELREEVAELERVVEIFESRIEWARSFVATLQNTKVTKPGFAFWEWEHRTLPSKVASERLGAVLMALDARAAGQWEKSDLWQEIPGVPSEVLYANAPLKISDVYELIKASTGLSRNTQVVEMFCCLKEKPVYSAITEYFWAAFG